MTPQLPLDFEPGLTVKFPEWEDVLAAAVYGSRKGLNGVAADLDMSPSELTRRLNRNTDDSRPLRASDAVKIVRSTGDKRPVYWWVEAFLQDPEATKNNALQQIATCLPMLLTMFEQAGIPVQKAKR